MACLDSCSADITWYMSKPTKLMNLYTMYGANAAMNIGTRVSFSPRRAPIDSTCTPSGNWKAAAISSSVEASAMTAVSPV